MEGVGDAGRAWAVQKRVRAGYGVWMIQGGCGWYRKVVCGTWGVWVLQNRFRWDMEGVGDPRCVGGTKSVGLGQ
jgi:hypothetical protein